METVQLGHEEQEGYLVSKLSFIVRFKPDGFS